MRDPYLFLVFFLIQGYQYMGGVIIEPTRVWMLWSLWDLARLTAMLFYIVAAILFRAETKFLTNALVILNFLSWISTVKYLRRIAGVREFIKLITIALIQMGYFIIIILVFYIGFATSLHIKPQEIYSPDHIGGSTHVISLLNQYKLIFADFGPWDDF